MWGILMVNVTIYSIHGSYGFGNDPEDLVLWKKNMGKPQDPLICFTSFPSKWSLCGKDFHLEEGGSPKCGNWAVAF